MSSHASESLLPILAMFPISPRGIARPAIIHWLIVLELVRRSQTALVDVNYDGRSHFPMYLALAEEFISDVFALARRR